MSEVNVPNIDRAHHLARKILAGGPYTIPLDVQRIAEETGILVRYQSLESSVSGMLVIKDGRPIIGVNETHHLNRQRFTLAHELGHFLLHGDHTQIFIDAIYYRDEESSEGIKRQEIEANAFAAELLMPESVLRELVGNQPIADADDAYIRRLAAQFGVSAQALTIRLTTLHLIGE